MLLREATLEHRQGLVPNLLVHALDGLRWVEHQPGEVELPPCRLLALALLLPSLLLRRRRAGRRPGPLPLLLLLLVVLALVLVLVLVLLLLACHHRWVLLLHVLADDVGVRVGRVAILARLDSASASAAQGADEVEGDLRLPAWQQAQQARLALPAIIRGTPPPPVHASLAALPPLQRALPARLGRGRRPTHAAEQVLLAVSHHLEPSGIRRHEEAAPGLLLHFCLWHDDGAVVDRHRRDVHADPAGALEATPAALQQAAEGLPGVALVFGVQREPALRVIANHNVDGAALPALRRHHPRLPPPPAALLAVEGRGAARRHEAEVSDGGQLAGQRRGTLDTGRPSRTRAAPGGWQRRLQQHDRASRQRRVASIEPVELEQRREGAPVPNRDLGGRLAGAARRVALILVRGVVPVPVAHQQRCDDVVLGEEDRRVRLQLVFEVDLERRERGLAGGPHGRRAVWRLRPFARASPAGQRSGTRPVLTPPWPPPPARCRSGARCGAACRCRWSCTAGRPAAAAVAHPARVEGEARARTGKCGVAARKRLHKDAAQVAASPLHDLDHARRDRLKAGAYRRPAQPVALHSLLRLQAVHTLHLVRLHLVARGRLEPAPGGGRVLSLLRR